MYEPSWILFVALVVAGVGAGFLNTMAGGGSMLTLPVLMLLGLPADVANGTNRVSVLSQAISGTLAFRKSGKLDLRSIGPVLLPTALGALGGSLLAAWVPAWLLKPILLGVMVTMALAMLVRPKLFGAQDDAEGRPATHPAAWGGLLLAGVYGGFVQAGVGFLLLGVLGGVMRLDLLRANALKLACVAVFGAVALTVFVIADQVVWVPGVILAVATVLGSLLGVRVALKVSQNAIRWVIFAAVVATCVGAWLKG